MTLTAVIECVRDRDYVSIVNFGSSVSTVFGLESVDDTVRMKFVANIPRTNFTDTAADLAKGLIEVNTFLKFPSMQ